MISEKLMNWIKTGVSKFKTPVYVYDKDRIIESCNIFTSIKYPNLAIHVATMANCNPDFLKLIKDHGCNVFVNSQMHLDEAKNVGYKGKQIIFTASSIEQEMMHKLHNENVYLNLDSVSQLDYWFENFPSKPVGIRCNIDNSDHKPKSGKAGYFIGENSRLGLNLAEIQSIKHKELINGLHIYVGTDITDVDYFISFYNALIEIAADFPNIEYLDFGGGFGINEENKQNFDFAMYKGRLTKLMNDFSESRGKLIKLILEPGRIIGGQAGYFICKVTDIKFRGNIQYVGVNASSTQFPRPLLYPDDAFHPVHLFDKDCNLKTDGEIQSKISGCSTYSRDYLSHNCLLPEAEIGDFVIFENSGAYCASMHTSFLGFEKPKEIFI